MMSKDEIRVMTEALNREFLANIGGILVGRTIVSVSNPSISSGVDEDEVIQEYVQLSMSDGSHVRIGVDYEECDILVYSVDDDGEPINNKVVARGDYLGDE